MNEWIWNYFADEGNSKSQATPLQLSETPQNNLTTTDLAQSSPVLVRGSEINWLGQAMPWG